VLAAKGVAQSDRTKAKLIDLARHFDRLTDARVNRVKAALQVLIG
jgi:hypothetical protein